MTARRRSVQLGALGAGAAAALFLGATQASPAAASPAGATQVPTVVGYTGWDTSLGGVTHEYFAPSCGDVFRGSVTSSDGSGDVVARIDSFTMTCDEGVTVAPHSLGWTFTSTSGGRSFTLAGIDLDITTSQGTCRYTGSVQGTEDDQGLYFMTGTLDRQSAGCGGDPQITVTDPEQ
ncbi:hypothetical protein, partial [Actinacidiphila bryophytorum]|nr:hypothetical protein [Actinacidiphila bryophytorum]